MVYMVCELIRLSTMEYCGVNVLAWGSALRLHSGSQE